MWYFIIIGCLLFGMLFTAKLKCQNPNKNSENNNSISINNPLNSNDTIKGMFSRKQIDEKLKHLAETPAPTKLSFGAECYKMAFKDYSVYEYVCPVCGEKTIYKKGTNSERSVLIENLENNLNSCRNEIEKVHGLNIKLDESQFCKHCSPNTENPQLCLLVNIGGQSYTTRVCNIENKDIQLIYEFLNDKLVHTGEQDEETPLVNNIDRIKKLLGLN
jgi:hypothetical protein